MRTIWAANLQMKHLSDTVAIWDYFSLRKIKTFLGKSGPTLHEKVASQK
jgi:hypothetical protein